MGNDARLHYSAHYHPFVFEKDPRGISRIQKKDNKWGDLFLTAMFLGMIAAFLGMGISGGLLSVFTLLSSAAIMAVCGILVKVKHVKWLENFALPISMLGAMALSILYTNVLPAQWLK